MIASAQERTNPDQRVSTRSEVSDASAESSAKVYGSG